MVNEEKNSNTRPIEEYFPINKVNAIAEKESVGFLKRKFRPHLYTHVWWARRLGCIFRSIILYSLMDEDVGVSSSQKKLGNPSDIWEYYSEDVDFSGKIIFDPFMGGGTTISEAVRFNANVIGCDLNPVAWFMVKNQLQPVAPEKIEKKFEKLKTKVKEEIQKYYKTTCPECREEADIIYTFWVKEVPCNNCGEKVSLFKTYRLESNFGDENQDIVFCPECSNVFGVENSQSQIECPECSFKFTPEKGNATRTKHTCRSCGQGEKTIDVVKKLERSPDHRMIAIKYECKNCEDVNFKKVTEDDKELFQKSLEAFKNTDVNVPTQKIPEGQETNRLHKWGYTRFHQMFNDRQLLCLSKILKEIMNFEDERIQELFLLPFSKALDSNNMFCAYDSRGGNLQNMFARHDLAPKKAPVENNVWGTDKGARTFENNVETLIEAMEFSVSPVERVVDDDELKKVNMDNEIKAELVDDFSEFSRSNNHSKALLFCQSSESFGEENIPNKEVDAVITDPPYYNNDQYSELSDFFYVWLRLALKDRYDHFQSDTTPKYTEIVKNKARGLTEEDYIEGLTSVFKECHRVLKDDGLMVFTFHHSETAAWSSVLKSILDSNFYVTAIYPINSEVSQSLLIREKGNIEYDTIVVCRRKDEEFPEKSWAGLRDQIYFRTKNIVEDLEEDHSMLSDGDIFVIALGKCLEMYSKYYPNVVEDGEEVSVEEAVESIREIVDEQILGGRFDELAEELDIPTATYLTYLAGRGESVSYSSLNKELRQRNIDLDELVESGLIDKEGSTIKKPNVDTLAARIRKKSNKELISIDRAHYLIYLQDKDKLADNLRDWVSEKAIKTLRILGEKEDKSEYKKLADYVEDKISQMGLSKF
ncbi:hypothetical protein AKJ36_00080 [candidate division MSBL1 archaeon SCGC-AAA259I07]|uniref:DNA methylase N-4/N-6 domain-containing protein n=1 Tax=candidate division MSBL1 archaeon SCGC-AAA259I07 TaxID=1698266 RepID=A0A133UMY3_9EURY|nr:hypothetical protein AKJ36_00080 [candidate division MSBL1 archaeon SCGC-AAA259I07]